MIHITNFFRPFFLACLFVGVAACTPTYINTEDLGPKATAQEIREHYSGNSIRYAIEPGGPVNVEAYFAPDGTYKLVALDGTPIFSTGTWQTNDTALPALQIDAQDYFVGSGGTRSRQSPSMLFWVYIQPDGSAQTDLVGGGNFSQPRPKPGFQAEGTYDQLRRAAGL